VTTSTNITGNVMGYLPPPKIYFCPSDPTMPTTGIGSSWTTFGGCCYAANWQVFGNATPSASGAAGNYTGWQNYPTLAKTFTDGTSNTVGFAEKYASGIRNPASPSPTYTASQGAAWANNDIPGDCFNPAFAVTVAATTGNNTYALYSPPPAMFQVQPQKPPAVPPLGSDINLASTSHPAMQALMMDGSVRSIAGSVSPTAVWWPLVTPGNGDIVGDS
jgi:hypothetical protein